MSNIIGIRNNNTIVPYVGATKRSKTINLSSYTTSAQAGFVADRCVGVFEADSSGNWRVTLNCAFSFTSASISSIVISIAGLTFKVISGGWQQAGCGRFNGTNNAIANVSAEQGGGGIRMTSLTADTAGGGWIACDVELNAEPTWASLGTTAVAALEGVIAADVYIAPASTTEDGLVNRSAQTFVGVKNFDAGIRLGSLTDTLDYYDTGTLPFEVWDGASNKSAAGYELSYTRLGNLITLQFPRAYYQSTNTARTLLTSAGAVVLPAALRPSGQLTFMYRSWDGDVLTSPGLLILATNGEITLFKDMVGNAFSTNNVTKGIDVSTITYIKA